LNCKRYKLMTTSNRWIIAAAGVLMQVALGAVYAWSVFRIPLTRTYGWTISEVTFAFELAILVLGFASFAGGLWMRNTGPRRIAVLAAILYGGGTVLAGLSHNLLILYLAYGVIAGAGLGLGYIVPVATLIRWFPDKRGMITGLAVAGFGAGALVTAPIAESLISSVGVAMTFEILGGIYLAIVLAAGSLMRNPPDGYTPTGDKSVAVNKPTSAPQNFTLRQALGSWQWYALWLTLFLNTMAGIAIISQASPMAQEISKVTASTAAGLVGLISIANGSGRLLWAWFSDAAGRRTVFLLMFLLQSAAFLLLGRVHLFSQLSVLAFLVLLCYGGGFGTMPAFAADYFGTKEIGSIYGIMLTAWGAAALFGPTLIARVRELTGHYQGAMQIMSVAMLFSAVVPLFLRPPSVRREAFGTTGLVEDEHTHAIR
jgi:OFA family oxalate/formate antiporter-like MFS transporter